MLGRFWGFDERGGAGIGMGWDGVIEGWKRKVLISGYNGR